MSESTKQIKVNCLSDLLKECKSNGTLFGFDAASPVCQRFR